MVDTQLDKRCAPHELFFKRVPSGRFDGGGNLVKHTRALYVQDLGAGNKSHWYLSRRPGGTRNAWHYKQMGRLPRYSDG
jgi:hypothetical protein